MSGCQAPVAFAGAETASSASTVNRLAFTSDATSQ